MQTAAMEVDGDGDSGDDAISISNLNCSGFGQIIAL